MRFRFPFVSILLALCLLTALIWSVNASAECVTINGQTYCNASDGPSFTPVKNAVRYVQTTQPVRTTLKKVAHRGLLGRTWYSYEPSTSYSDSAGSAGRSGMSVGRYQSQGTYTEAVETAEKPDAKPQTGVIADCDCECPRCLARNEELKELRAENARLRASQQTRLPAAPTSKLDPIRDDTLIAMEWRLRESNSVPSINANRDGVQLAAIDQRRQ